MTTTRLLARWTATLLALVLMHSSTAQAQEAALPGILDIAFGTSMEEARDALLGRDGVTFDPVHSNADHLVADGGTFADEAVNFWLLAFVEDRMHTAKAIVQPEEEAIIATYENLIAHLTAQYGAPDDQVSFFDDPYEMGDGFETYAIRFGKGHFAALWRFSDGESQNVISLSIDDDLYIPIVFQSGALIDLAIAKQEREDLSGL